MLTYPRYNMFIEEDDVLMDYYVGQAPVGGVCTDDRISIVEDMGRYRSIVTAAHELGHK